MLQAIRERAQGWIAWVIVILISVPFALWGIQEYLGIGSEPVVASVNGQEITQRELDQRFHQFKMELRQRLGSAYRPGLFDDVELRREVLDDMIRNILVLQASADMGLRAGDDQVRATIMSLPAFQKDGSFDKATYERSLRFQGFTSAQFEHKVRASLMASQLSQAVNASELTTGPELDEAIRLRRQQREFSYFVLPLDRFRTDAPVTDEEIATYYREHQAEFRLPEQVKLDYIVLEPGGAGVATAADEAALRELYRSHQDEFRTPEQRRARHILLTVGDGADQDKVRAQIEDIRRRILDREDFGTLAREFSQDPGSAGEGGDLGFFDKGLMDPAFDDAAFSLAEGELSGPVRTRFGYHLIEVTGIRPATVKPFEEVREQLAKQYRSGEMESRYFELAERLGNLTYETPDSLVPAADGLGLEVRHSGWIGREGGAGVLASPKVMATAFSEDVLREGNNSELVELDGKDGQKAVVVRVTEHREASQEPMEEVRDKIERAVRDQRARKAAVSEAEALVERLRGGESLAAVAQGYELEQPGLVARETEKVPGQVLGSAFTLPHPREGKKSFGFTSLADGGAAVVGLSRVADGSAGDLDDRQRELEGRSMARTLARNYYEHVVSDLQRRADIQIMETEAREQ